MPIFSPDVGAMLSRYCVPSIVSAVRRASLARDEQLAEAGASSTLGQVTSLVARAAGMSRPDIRAVRAIMDAADIGIDLTDNLGDWDEDSRTRRNVYRHYRGIPRPVLHCLPPLLSAALVAETHRVFTRPGLNPRAASRKLIAAVALAAEGQGLAADAPGRPWRIAGAQGRLLAFPLWIARDRRASAVEAWGAALVMASHFHHEAATNPGLRKRASLSAAAALRALPPFLASSLSRDG